MSFLKDVLRGIAIGVANIIPGVSGGTMMVAMGLYDHLIHAITHLKSEFKKSMKHSGDQNMLQRRIDMRRGPSKLP